MLQQLQVLEGHTDIVWCIAWSPDGTRLASCSADKTVRIWGMRDTCWVCVGILDDTHSRTVRCVAWSPDGTHLAVASFDATTSIWQCQGDVWEHVALLEGHENEVKHVAWSPTGHLLATCSRDRSVWIWEALPGNEYECVDVKTGHTQDVKSVAWHPRHPVLMSCSYDDCVKLWQEQGDDWECVHTVEGHGGTVWAAAFDAEGDLMATACDDGSLYLWRWQGGGDGPTRCTLVSRLDAHSRSVLSVSWARSLDLVASCSADNAVQVYAVDRHAQSLRKVGGQAEAHAVDVNCVSWRPSHEGQGEREGLLASCGDDGLVKLWVWRS